VIGSPSARVKPKLLASAVRNDVSRVLDRCPMSICGLLAAQRKRPLLHLRVAHEQAATENPSLPYNRGARHAG
jgi:hypothetical protein